MSAKSEEHFSGSRENTGAANQYEIGYGRPPQHSRFKKGQSGNPTGRRRYTDSQRGKQLLLEEANRLVTIREGEKKLRIPAVQAALRSLFFAAMKGNTSAQRMVLNALGEIETAGAKPPSAINRQEPDYKHFTDEELHKLEAIYEAAEQRIREQS
jgi:Family of unknown function (DUF5681)